MKTKVFARNQNLEDYLNDIIQNNRLRWVYLRSGRRIKVGLIATYFKTDPLGRKEVYVGVSKAALNKGDKFELDLGLVRAIENSVPFAQFLKRYEQQKLPKVPLTWRVVRDEMGYVVENEYESYDQYEEFVEKLKNVYARLVSSTPILV